MKETPNVQTTIPRGTKGDFATFADLIRDSLDWPPEGGFKPSQMRARARVDAALVDVKAGGVIKLEDADYATVKEALGACPWRIRSPDLIQLLELFGL